MGIEGLPTQLKDAYVDGHISQFKEEAVVVDVLSWLHKACYGCAYDLALGNETQTYIAYVMRRVNLLRSEGIHPILVFDGLKIPLKADTHDKRKAIKESNRNIAMKSFNDAKGSTGEEKKILMAKTVTYFQRSVSITKEIIHALKIALKEKDVEFVTAPYEADAQMVYLCKIKKASAIITEDSDILVYSIVANISAPILLKLDPTGNCKIISKSILKAHNISQKSTFLSKIPHFLDDTPESIRMFVQMCVLSGCDFLGSLPGVGPVKAQKYIFQFRGAPGNIRIKRLIAKWKQEKISVPSDYYERFCTVESLFYHHYVYNPDLKRVENLVNEMDLAHLKEIYEVATSGNFLGELPSADDMASIYFGYNLASLPSQVSSQSSQETAVSLTVSSQRTFTSQSVFTSQEDLSIDDDMDSATVEMILSTPPRLLKKRDIQLEKKAIRPNPSKIDEILNLYRHGSSKRLLASSPEEYQVKKTRIESTSKLTLLDATSETPVIREIKKTQFFTTPVKNTASNESSQTTIKSKTIIKSKPGSILSFFTKI